MRGGLRVCGAGAPAGGCPLRLRIASLNVWGLPLGLSSHAAERFEAIAAALPALELDAIGLQEVWTEEARDALFAGGRAAGLVHQWDSGASTGGGGLALLSRHPLRDVAFQRFALRGLPQNVHHGDYNSHKGFVTATLETPAGPVALADTHLHAQYTTHDVDPYHGHRVGQIVEIGLALREIVEPLVAVGDFNMREDRPEHRVFVGLSGMRDVAAALDRRQPTSLPDHPYRQDGIAWEPSSRIDYVFARPGSQRGLTVHGIRRIFDEPLRFAGEPGAYSDHAGLLAEVEVTGPAAAPPPVDGAAVREAEAILLAGREAALARRGDQRWLAAGAGATAVAAWTSRRHTRRGVLRALGATVGIAALPVGCGALALAGPFHDREREAYDAVLARVQGML